MSRIRWILLAIVSVVALATYIDLPATHSVAGARTEMNLGIDLAGGSRLLLCGPKGVSSADMDTAREVINARIAGGFGVTEPRVNRVGANCISAEVPGLNSHQQNQLVQIVGKTGYLALTDSGDRFLSEGTQVKLVCPPGQRDCAPQVPTGVTKAGAVPPVLQVVVPGKYVKQGSAQMGTDEVGRPVVSYALTGEGSSAWCTYTTSHVGGYSAIVLDGRIVSDPQIQEAICGGQTQITGLQSAEEAQKIATYLNYGSLPVPLTLDSSQQVAATLGPEYVRGALQAGIIGLSIVALFMLLYYRLPGLLADLALVMYAAVVFALFKLFGVTMTLAAIAGFILSIGMAVDANILIIERMKEELRSGKTLRAAAEAGFQRAFPSIRDSNIATILTSLILFWFGHSFAASTITGFATTLIIGVAVSFVTAVFVSHTLLRVLIDWGVARKPTLYGVEEIAERRAA